MATLGAVPASFALVQKMRFDPDYFYSRYVLGGIVADENQKLLLKLEETIMSAITPVLQEILTKVTALKTNNDSLAASLVEKDQQIAAAQAQLDAALQNATDATDAQVLADIKAALG
jgi:hypothetical protein